MDTPSKHQPLIDGLRAAAEFLETWKHVSAIVPPKEPHPVFLLNASGHVRSGAKLTRDDVNTIRQRYASGERSMVLAEAFGISKRQVCSIVANTAWRN